MVLDELYDPGKVAAMNVGLINAIGAMKLYNAAGAAIVNSATGLTSTDFTVNATTGVLSNVTTINFTIVAGDVGKTITYVILQNSAQTSNLIRIDLETSVALTTAGTATFAIGALTADL